MITVKDILNYVETIAPSYMKEDWDNVGLLCGSKETVVTKVMVALDPFEHVCQEAAHLGAQLILTHHPIIFEPITNVTDETSIGRSLQLLCQNGISAINAHTNLDCAPGGINDTLANVLGLKDVKIIHPKGTDEAGREYGLLRQGLVDEQSLDDFLHHVKAALDCRGLKYVYGGKPVKHVAVGGGACASELMDAYRAGCDTFVTSDVKYNGFWDAKDLGMNLIDAGHYHTENPVVAVLAAKVQAAFPEIQVLVSKKHDDCANFFV